MSFENIINNKLFTITNFAAIGAIVLFWFFVSFSLVESANEGN